MSEAASDYVHRIGAFTFDPASGLLLTGDGAPRTLRPKLSTMLAHLARNAGRVVAKAELMDIVWPGIFVTEDSLTQSIKELRKVLGEDSIRTIPKRGYMLTHARREQEAPATLPAVAVLRFSSDGEDALLADGVAEEVINGLTCFDMLRVVARHSSFMFGSASVADIGEVHSRLGADYLVLGSVRRRGDRFQFDVTLLDAASSAQLWSDRFSAGDDDLFNVMDDITGSIISQLSSRIELAGWQKTARAQPGSLAAYQLVLQGVALLREPSQRHFGKAEALLADAIRIDPTCAAAYAHLAFAKMMMGGLARAGPTVLREARELAARSIELSPEQATGHRIMALARVLAREHEAAEQHMRVALARNPHDVEAIEQMGYVLTLRGRPLEGLEWLDRAMRLNPLHQQWYQYDRALALYMLGEYRAAAQALRTATHPPPWIRTRLAASLAQAGDLDAAIREMDALRAEVPEFSPLGYARTGLALEREADAEHLAQGVMMAMRS